MYAGALGLLLRFARANHTSSERGPGRIANQMVRLGAFLALVMSLWFGVSRIFLADMSERSRVAMQKIVGTLMIGAVDSANQPVGSYTVVVFREGREPSAGQSFSFIVNQANRPAGKRPFETHLRPGRYSIVAVEKLGEPLRARSGAAGPSEGARDTLDDRGGRFKDAEPDAHADFLRRVSATNMPLRLLVRMAYEVQDFRIVGGPSGSSRINSTSWRRPRRLHRQHQDVLPLMKALLAERFKLKVHTKRGRCRSPRSSSRGATRSWARTSRRRPSIARRRGGGSEADKRSPEAELPRWGR